MANELVVLLDSWKDSQKASALVIDLALLSDCLMENELVVLLDSSKDSQKASELVIDLALLSEPLTAKESVHTWAHLHVPRLCPQNFRHRSWYKYTCRNKHSSHFRHCQEIGDLLLFQATTMNTDNT